MSDRELDIIKSVPDGTARTILLSLCEDATIRRKAFDISQRLLGAAAGDASLAVCGRCKGTFDVNDNRPDACKYHPGNFELDYESEEWEDSFLDTDPSVFENDPNWKESNPDGFKWSCCEQVGKVEGCRSSKHVFVESHAQTARNQITGSRRDLTTTSYASEKQFSVERLNNIGTVVQVLGERSGNKRKSEGDDSGVNGHRAKKGADGYGLGIFD